MKTADQNLERGAAIVEELRRLRVGHFCVAPGARCTPLALAVARNERVTSTVFYDERALGFFALGHAKGSNRPAVVVTTSGTAVANLLPAVMEASAAQVPLVLITADRPPELRGSGANQTVDQVKVFGDLVRSYTELHLSDPEVDPGLMMSQVDRAVLAAEAHRGPVHINVCIRKPLGVRLPAVRAISALTSWRSSGEPWTRSHLGARIPDVETLQRLASVMSASRRGLCVVGALHDDQSRRAAVRLAEGLGWPMLVDVSAGVPCGLHGIDLMLAASSLRDLNPDVVVHLGGPVVSGRYIRWMDSWAHTRLIAVGPSAWAPTGSVTDHIVADLPALVPLLETRVHPSLQAGWAARFEQAHEVSRGVPLTSDMLEAQVAQQVASLGRPVVVGASLSVRDLDDYAPVTTVVTANRGASGIDGTLATAAGWATAMDEAVVVLVGDQTFLHDAGSLALLRDGGHLVVVVNNGGGGIFRRLPVAGAGAAYETHVAARHEQRIAPMAEAMGWNVVVVDSLEGVVDAFAQPLAGGGPSTLVEVMTDAEANHVAREQHRTQVAEAIETALGDTPVLTVVGGA